MGGTSTKEDTQTQSSQSNPWEPAQGALTGILGQLNGNLGHTGLTGTESGALNTLSNNASQGNPYSGQIGSFAQSLLNGGGATNQAGAVNQNYQNYQNAMQPLASNTNYNPNQTPGFSDAIKTMTGDITNNVNGSFAAAGRDFSGANQQALARGLTQGLAPTIAAQYNQNVNNQQGAAGNLYNAGNTNAGVQSGMQQQYLANQGQGVNASQSAIDAGNYGPQAQMAIEAQRRGIPVGALGMLAQIGIPIAGLGGQSTGTGKSNTTQQMSGAQQFGTIASGIGSILGGAGNFMGGYSKFMPSDRRLKQDIEQVGTLFDGQPVYGFYYRGSPTYTIGLIAQEVAKVIPDAVHQKGEYMSVDYHAATAPSRQRKEAA